MINLLDLDPAALDQWLSERGQKSFRARQVSRSGRIRTGQKHLPKK